MKLFFVVCGTIFALIIICCVVVAVVARKIFAVAFDRNNDTYFKNRTSKDEGFLEYRKNGEAFLKALPFRKYEMTSFDGLKLVGRYFFDPYKKADKLLVAVHGYRGSGFTDFGGQSDYWFRRGFDIFLPDNRAHGESEGRYIGFGVTESRDLLDWLKILACDHDRIYVSGISMGCATVLAAADKMPPQVEGLIGDCGFTSPAAQFEDLGIKPKIILKQVAGLCRKKAGFDFFGMDTTKAVASADVPILFIHGETDKFIKKEMTITNYNACVSKKQLLIVKGAGHPKSHYVAPTLYESTIDDFFGLKKEERNE